MTQLIGNSKIGVQRRPVPEHSDVAPHGTSICHEVEAENFGPFGSQRHQPGAGSKQRRLASAVGSADPDDLTGRHAEVDARQCWETVQQGHDTLKGNSSTHGAPRLRLSSRRTPPRSHLHRSFERVPVSASAGTQPAPPVDPGSGRLDDGEYVAF